MPRKQGLQVTSDDANVIALRLPVPEREVIITSRQVRSSGLQDRVRNAPPRRAIEFELEELEDLHRGLAFDAEQTLDTKRRKSISKVLRKIEELLDDEEEFNDDEGWFGDEWDDAPSVPSSPQELFEQLFGPAAPDRELPMPKFRIRLTASQRDTIVGMDTVSLDIHKMLSVDSQEELEFEFNPRQFMTMSMAIKEAITSCDDSKSQLPYLEVAQRISDSLYADIEDAAESEGDDRFRVTAPAAVAYQLKITLEDSKPPIWRRVQIADCTLDVLHEIVQTAMGWTNSHLHMFEYGEDRFSDPRFELDSDDYDEAQVYLSQLVANGCQKLRYWYDFGDDWWHTIKIEKTLELKMSDTLPKCIKGVGACPPEDCGGIWGYYDLLDAIKDRKHPRHEELVDWIGPSFDPNAFDLEETNAAFVART